MYPPVPVELRLDWIAPREGSAARAASHQLTRRSALPPNHSILNHGWDGLSQME
jgi:hypothetical protein